MSENKSLRVVNHTVEHGLIYPPLSLRGAVFQLRTSLAKAPLPTDLTPRFRRAGLPLYRAGDDCQTRVSPKSVHRIGICVRRAEAGAKAGDFPLTLERGINSRLEMFFEIWETSEQDRAHEINIVS